MYVKVVEFQLKKSNWLSRFQLVHFPTNSNIFPSYEKHSPRQNENSGRLTLFYVIVFIVHINSNGDNHRVTKLGRTLKRYTNLKLFLNVFYSSLRHSKRVLKRDIRFWQVSRVAIGEMNVSKWNTDENIVRLGNPRDRFHQFSEG